MTTTDRQLERDARDAAFARVDFATSEAFRAAVLNAIQRRATTGAEFNADEIRADLTAQGIAIERPTAMGTVFSQAARLGWISRTGGKRATDVAGGHARSYDLWCGTAMTINQSVIQGARTMTSIPLDDLPVANDARRDQWKRYLVVPPNGIKPVGYTRVTTVAKALDSGGGLAPWKAAMTAQGLIMRRGLRAQWEALMAEAGGDPWYRSKQTKAQAKKLVEDCAAVGGANDRREMGSALHAISALFDKGHAPAHLTDETEADMEAYRNGLIAAGVSIVPGQVELTVVLDDYHVAGTFDRLVNVPGFALPLIADLKTGADLSYSWQSIAVQLAAYSRANDLYLQGPNPDGSEDTREPMPAVDQRWGLVMWLNANSAELELYLVDLEAGWQAFEQSLWARGWRSRKDVAMPLSEVNPDRSVPPPDYEATQHEAAAIAAGRPSPDAFDDLAAQLEASVSQHPSGGPHAERRHWLQERIDLIGRNERARPALALMWPSDIPALRQSTSHTPEQLDDIEELLNEVEAGCEMPFGPPKPTDPAPDDARITEMFFPKQPNNPKEPT